MDRDHDRTKLIACEDPRGRSPKTNVICVVVAWICSAIAEMTWCNDKFIWPYWRAVVFLGWLCNFVSRKLFVIHSWPWDRFLFAAMAIRGRGDRSLVSIWNQSRKSQSLNWFWNPRMRNQKSKTWFSKCLLWYLVPTITVYLTLLFIIVSLISCPGVGRMNLLTSGGNFFLHPYLAFSVRGWKRVEPAISPQNSHVGKFISYTRGVLLAATNGIIVKSSAMCLDTRWVANTNVTCWIRQSFLRRRTHINIVSCFWSPFGLRGMGLFDHEYEHKVLLTAIIL